MTTFILILLIIITGTLGAYTLNFAKTTLNLGKRLAPENPFLSRGFQDTITPPLQTIRGITWPILILGILVYGIVLYKWYFGIGFAILTFFVVIPILKNILPKADSEFYIRRVRKSLLERQSLYIKFGDAAKETAIREILARMDKLERDTHA